MGYELRTQVVEPKRHTFSHLIERFGDKPASRYQEASFDIQPTENFHYRPTWDQTHALYDPDYTVGALPLTSNTRPSFTTTGVGPSPMSRRPTSTASRQSSGNMASGRGNLLFVITRSLQLDLQHIADVVGGDAQFRTGGGFVAPDAERRHQLEPGTIPRLK